ncbi:TonB-dependent receptor [Hydrogenophaga crassostreae]|uniref:TonB-dependent receptor n=1 Tax=Hydrogenophaga crassostreae TaxID=1763535 RepID=A0A167IQQ5_9BURK|nr:TonB-dependent receptor [Hydrogenophaga crassostreae]AOW15822.1 TonB-dependent receptor [Hydrogenophaga crassostreae]OAD43376.1 TonB-dependent receptor [Hydrogenophaga crassostreae]
MKHHRLKAFHLAMAAAVPVVSLMAAQAMAQGASNPSLPTVTVREKAPVALQPAASLHGEDLVGQRAATSDTASLLRGVPGVSLRGAGGVSSLPAIQGLADDRLRIRVDGMDLIASCPNHMNPALSYITPSQLGALKVYPGISPVSEGGDSIGGSILAESAAPVFATPDEGAITDGEVGAFYRSNNQARGANLSARYATPTLSLGYSGSVSRADNYLAGADFKDYTFTGRTGHSLALDEVGSTAYDTRNHALSLAYKRDAHLFEARVGVQDMPYQLYPNQRMDMLDNDQRSINLSYTGNMDWGRVKARLYDEKVDHFMDFGADKRYWYGMASGGSTALDGRPCGANSAMCAAGMPMYTEGKTQGASLSGEIALNERDLLRLGTELQRYSINDWWPASGGGMYPGTFWNIRDGERNRTAAFGEWERNANAQWMTLAGLRVEQVRMDAGDVVGYNPAGMGFQARDAEAFNASDRKTKDNNIDVTLLARYTASDHHDIEFGFAHKERSPNVYERFPWSTWGMAALMNNFVGDGNGYIGNLGLKPEKADTVSATFNWHAADKAWGVTATPFYTRVEDYIDAQQWNGMSNQAVAQPASNQFSVLRYTNQAARLYGLDLTGHMPLARNGWGDWGLKGLLNYTNGRNRDTGDGLYNTMPLNAQLALTHKSGGWDNSIELVTVKAKTDVSEVRNEVTTPGYGLVHLRGSYSWKTVRIDFGIENLFDRLYGLPTGGAYVGQGTTMANPMLPNYPQWGTAVPGMGRTFYTGVNVKF